MCPGLPSIHIHFWVGVWCRLTQPAVSCVAEASLTPDAATLWMPLHPMMKQFSMEFHSLLREVCVRKATDWNGRYDFLRLSKALVETGLDPSLYFHHMESRGRRIRSTWTFLLHRLSKADRNKTETVSTESPRGVESDSLGVVTVRPFGDRVLWGWFTRVHTVAKKENTQSRSLGCF